MLCCLISKLQCIRLYAYRNYCTVERCRLAGTVGVCRPVLPPTGSCCETERGVGSHRCMQHEHRQARRRRLSRCITHTDLEEVCFVLQPLIFILSICGIQTLNFKEQNSFIVHEQLCTMVVSKIEKKQSAFL